jgi:hypothetical protein
MMSNSARRKGRNQWRYVLGLSVLGFLIIASASSHASETAQVAPQSASAK